MTQASSSYTKFNILKILALFFVFHNALFSAQITQKNVIIYDADSLANKDNATKLPNIYVLKSSLFYVSKQAFVYAKQEKEENHNIDEKDELSTKNICSSPIADSLKNVAKNKVKRKALQKETNTKLPKPLFTNSENHSVIGVGNVQNHLAISNSFHFYKALPFTSYHPIYRTYYGKKILLEAVSCQPYHFTLSWYILSRPPPASLA